MFESQLAFDEIVEGKLNRLTELIHCSDRCIDELADLERLVRKGLRFDDLLAQSQLNNTIEIVLLLDSDLRELVTNLELVDLALLVFLV